ncbi:MAG: IscS subfamily cysteine desulfurase [Alphaproteobacteria bacterium]|nr:MAG: IscS subfamily cysteine desulfurase [Alphaproteobacteria bacterium]
MPHKTIKLPVYLDYQATTPCDPRVLNKMLPYFTEKFGNPHSRNHKYGWEAEEAVQKAREQIAALINAHPSEIIFTSGATESNNIAIKGVHNFYKGHVITSQIEHKCVLETCRSLGTDVTYLPVKSNGIICIKEFKKAIRPDTKLVSIMAASNEIGTIQPIKQIGEICREKGIFFHTDAAQAVGKIPIDVKEMNIDLMSISGHKLYGPKGIGCLYVGKKPRVRIKSILSGGGQERGMRSGTLPTPLCVGLGEACEIAKAEMTIEQKRLKSFQKKIYDALMNNLEDVYLNGDLEKRLPGNLNLSFAYVEGEGLMMRLKDLCISSGSACTSESLEPSYVLKAIGVGEDLAHTSLRFGLGRFTTPEEVDYTIDRVIKEVKSLREMSPLYDMAKQGIDIKSINWVGH